MKKRIVSILLILLMLLSIAGCGEKEKEQTVTSNQEATNSVADGTTDAPTDTPTDTPTDAPTQTPTTSSNSKKLVALTFNDGPGEYTSEIVKILKENNANATFFLVGSNIKYNKDAVKEAYLAGNEIAVHSFYHDSFYELDLERIKKEISTTQKLINEFVQVECSDLVRPPYGEITDEVVNEIDSSIILWSIDSKDDERKDSIIKEQIQNSIKDGSIILFHEQYDNVARVLKEILPMYSDEYEFVTVTELFERKGITLEKNKIYNSAVR